MRVGRIERAADEALIRFAESVSESVAATNRALDAVTALLEAERARFDGELAEIRDWMIELDHRIAESRNATWPQCSYGYGDRRCILRADHEPAEVHRDDRGRLT